DLLAASVAPRPRAAVAEARSGSARRVRAALADPSESDRGFHRRDRWHREKHCPLARARLRRRHPADRSQAGSLRIFVNRRVTPSPERRKKQNGEHHGWHAIIGDRRTDRNARLALPLSRLARQASRRADARATARLY